MVIVDDADESATSVVDGKFETVVARAIGIGRWRKFKVASLNIRTADRLAQSHGATI
jgi:hypothetical protein